MRRALPPLVLLLTVALFLASAAGAQAHARRHTVYFGTFRHRLNSHFWLRYDGTPRCCSNTVWASSHAVVKRGVLRLQNYRDPAHGNRWVSAGVSMGRSINRVYGRYRVRFRMDKGIGVGMCIFLWPKSGWPPEIDFAEESSDVGGRRYETSTLHYGSHNTQIHHRVHANFTKWHVMGINWRPGRLVYTLDGRKWARIIGPMVPSTPMHLGIQTHVGSNGKSGGLPDATTPAHVTLQIDWVRIQAYD